MDSLEIVAGAVEGWVKSERLFKIDGAVAPAAAAEAGAQVHGPDESNRISSNELRNFRVIKLRPISKGEG